MQSRHLATLFVLLLILPRAAASEGAGDGAGEGWRKHSINDRSPFEGAGAADFTADGKVDIFSGDTLYEAPSWKRHKVREVAPSGHYHDDFADLPLDVNGDGLPDIVTCTYFTGKVAWLENPGAIGRPWIEHLIDKPGASETAQLVDIDGDGRLDLLPNTVGTVVWYELAAQAPEVRWVKHDLGKEGAGHGVGYGDISGDGRLDIITPKGWYEQPADPRSGPWTFHPEFQLGAAGILILGYDVTGNGRTDIVWGMGHDYGLYWLEQKSGAEGRREWQRHEIDRSFSQVHTLIRADLDGDGEPEVVTGKRIYAHEVEPGATGAPCIYTFQYDRAARSWRKRVLYEGEPARSAPEEAKDRRALDDFPRGSVGTGLQLEARDIDGDGDIDLVCPGKSGLYLLENLRPAPRPPEPAGLDIYWIDVEGGAATLLVTPAGESVLIDAGNPGERDAGRIHKALIEAGLERVDHLVVTHFHGDHFGGVADLARRLPIERVYDYGIPENDAPDGRPSRLIAPCRAATLGKRVILLPGDSLPLRQSEGSPPLEIACLASRGEFIPAPPGAPANPHCAETREKPEDLSENGKSIVLLVSFGSFRFLDCGDLTWNFERRLVCPVNLAGRVDLFQVNHHGLDQSNNPVLIRAVEPRVAVINNGPRKGCEPETFAALKATPSIEAIYQVHRNVRVGSEGNTLADHIANLEEACEGELIKLSVSADGKEYRVSIPARKHERRFQTRS
jgi:hypothetical protein